MSDQYPVLSPEDIPGIALESMNATHHEEAVLVNTLGALLQRADDGKVDEAAISAALDEWITHTEEHFARENRLMQEYGFPPYAIHAEEHASALENLRQIQQQWTENHQAEDLGNFVFNTWPQWFQMHVNSMDNVTAQFLSSFVD
ncbi:bacteriohemerythrin [Thiolapillus sp.]